MNLVFLHGGAASGKLTIARALHSKLNYGVFHNHLVVDALTAVFPFGTPPFVTLREEFWLATFRAAAASDTSLIFTFSPEHTVTPGFPERAKRSVEDGGGRISFVQLVVSEVEQERRISLPSRFEFAKLTDVETLRRLRKARGDVESPPTDLLVDTERLVPERAAALIVRELGLAPKDEHLRYPAV